MTRRALVLAIAVSTGVHASGLQSPRVLPAHAAATLRKNLESAKPHASLVWRDTPPANSDGTINAYVEISRGDRRKWEFNIAKNERAIDRMIPEDVGGYPVNYGFVPQTVSYDGDPFDALVLGPPIPGGRLIRGIPVGIMFMEDEKGPDSKVVLSTADSTGRPRYRLTASTQRELTDYFRRYKRHEPNAFSRVPGWGSAAEGVALVRLTHTFFRDCRGHRASPCAIDP